MSVWTHAAHLGAPPAETRISLGEGATPLVRSRAIGPSAGIAALYFKLESTNPSGSYKDRFAAGAISHMLAAGQRRCLATSSGNTGAALAAYCAAAGMPCTIAILETTPLGKVRQMLAYGAQLLRVRGFGVSAEVNDAVITTLRTVAQKTAAAVQVSAFSESPLGMAVVQSLGIELAAALPCAADVFSPAGGGGLTLATARGLASVPDQPGSGSAIHCVQPEGNNTIAGPLRQGATAAQAVSCTSGISGLQVASVMDGDAVIARCRARGGTGYLVSDEAILAAQRRLAQEEGVFCEPAGATALAGALAAAAAGELNAGRPVVCLVTGTGFKDETSLTAMIADAPCPLIDDAAALADALASD
jgi:threonine synthase